MLSSSSYYRLYCYYKRGRTCLCDWPGSRICWYTVPPLPSRNRQRTSYQYLSWNNGGVLVCSGGVLVCEASVH